MKNKLVLIISLAVFSLIDGYLLSAISLVGRVGISIFYTQYRFLKSWWKGAILVFVVWMFLLLLLSLLQRKAKKTVAAVVEWTVLIIAIAGLCMSYADFRTTLSHRWLGERFHLGVFLFWLGWIAISIFILLQKITASQPLVIENDEKKF